MSNELEIKGIRWPLKFRNGKVTTSSGLQHLKESILQIIAIGKGEYIMKPDYFSNMPSRIFDEVNQTALMNADITEALARFEKRIKLLNIGTNQSDINLGEVLLEITFKVLGNDEITQVSFKQ